MVVLNTDDPPASPFLTVCKKKMQVAKKKKVQNEHQLGSH